MAMKMMPSMKTAPRAVSKGARATEADDGVGEAGVEAHARRESKGQVGSDADEEGGQRRGARRHDDQVTPELLRALDVRVGEDSGQEEGLVLVKEAARVGRRRGLDAVRGLVEGARVARASRVRDDGRVDREDVRLDGQSLRIGDFGRGWCPGPPTGR